MSMLVDPPAVLPGHAGAVTITRVTIAGAGTLDFERDRASGALLVVRGGGRAYLRVDASGVWHWEGIGTVREERRPDGMDRHVVTDHGAWCERYRWVGDALTEVDGVVVRRDAHGRVVACLPGGADPAPATHRWYYGHDEGGLRNVTGPSGVRTLGLDDDGRVRSLTGQGVSETFAYDGRGVRRGPSRPAHDQVDEAGRCWATRDPDGTVRSVHIWDGTRCLARIDGPPGAPLAAVFSLDPSATPVRVTTPRGGMRIPRDAYGESLLAHRGIPGLFSGQVHGGLVHLPLRRLDPRTGAFCEPDPCAGGDDDPRRLGGFEGPLPAEPDARSTYEVCRGDPIGRADPTGGVSAGLVISDLTWSFQNNILSFFGIDWWFNLFASLIVAPFKGVADIDYDFFSSTGLVSSDHLGAFGVRRGGIINAITGGRAFTTQHIVWSPDHEFAELEEGEVVDPGGPLELSHHGTILAITPENHPRVLLQSMALTGRDWVSGDALPSWSRHGGVGVPSAPGTLTPWFPAGGLHLDTPLTTTRHDLPCAVTELAPAATGLGDLEERSFLTAATPTGLRAGDQVLVEEGGHMLMAGVVAVLAAGAGQRIQLDRDLDPLGTSDLSLTQRSSAPASDETLPAGPVADSLDVRGASATYAAHDLLRLEASGGEATIGRVARLEASIPLERPLPADLAGPISVSRGVLGLAVPVTVVGDDLDVGAAVRPAVGSTGLVSGGGTDVAVRVVAHVGDAAMTLDTSLPAEISAAGTITYRPVTAGTVLGTRQGDAEPGSSLTYTPSVAGAAPDGGAATVVVRCEGGGLAHARVVTGAPMHDVAVLDRTLVGSGPFGTQRFTLVGSTARGLTRADVIGLVVPDPARFADAPAVFLTKVDGSPPAAAHTPLTGVDVTAGVLTTISTAIVAGPGLEPGRPVLVGTRAAAIRTVRVTVTFTDAFDLSSEGLRLVELRRTGRAHLGTVVGAAEVVVQPTIELAGTTLDVPFPRFADGDLVRLTDRSGADATWHRIRVDGVAGGRLDLVDGPALTPGDDVLVSQVATVDPASGGPFLGVDGRRSGGGATGSATFTVWGADRLTADLPVGIVDGGTTRPTTIAAGAQSVEVTFGEAFDATGVDVVTLDRVADRFVATIARDGGVLLLDGPVGDLATGPDESIVAVAYEPAGDTTTATIGPGTLLVPEQEGVEVDRSQSLVDHELTHTLQYARWGPLWFNIFPMLAMELPGILATDTELPEFSPFLDATVGVGTDDRWNLTIGDTGGVGIAAGDELQVVQGARRARVTVAAVGGAGFEVRAVGTSHPPVGDVSVRKLQRAAAFDDWFAFFDLLTHGGLVNVLAGSTWGGIFWLIGKAFYGLGRAIGGTGELYAATVQAGGGAVTLTDADDAQHLRPEGRIVIRRGDDTVVRSMTRAGTVITLAEGVGFTGDVRVAMYGSHEPGSAFDWYAYHPATVDVANPFVIELDTDGGEPLGLSPEDRVVIRYRDNRPSKTDVLAVDGTRVELLAPITVVGGERSLRIARIGSRDPLGNADSAAMVEMGMGWMKWIFDPYGQIDHAVAADEEWSRWLLRVMRWILGTQNFSLLPGGYLWWGRLIPLLVGPEHVTPIEQEASERSGDLYSPLGRVFGERTEDGYARYRMVVGDIARYRYWPLARGVSFVTGGGLDGPGVHAESHVRTMPNRDATGAGTVPPNGAVVVGGTAEPGSSVAEPFTRRDPDPRTVPAADPLGFEVGPLGHVPVSARVQRMTSTYVAFTRPGDHRLTTINDAHEFFGFQRAVDAFDRERQELFYDVTVTDVTVRVAGRLVDDTAPGTSDRVVLVPFQRATVDVTPNGSRTYRITVPDPVGGAVRTDGARLIGAAVTGPDPVTVEISRYHRAVNGDYGPGGLAFAGMHLSRDLDVPVRRLRVEVTDQLGLRTAPAPDAAVSNSLTVGGEAFLLVPAPIVRPPAVTSVDGDAPDVDAANPISRVDAPDAEAYLGTGGAAFRLSFPADAAVGEVVVTVTVGDDTGTAELACTFALTGS